ncbi:response regulator transcription factor [Sediminibacterium soli]|uniref:response regulator transcription factor n=1 Tax=Sediminibacterium soli TaxID=2698829 RepID=UPI001379DD4C|nr:response regulator transcription factor [Sediminibacterium soli]NCI47986.1 response regulator transcription factor [Sediminibacterium soli]
MIKIAIVDDHVILRKSLAVLIHMFDDQRVIMDASNGQEFIEQLVNAEELPDIVLMDITMPVMDGVATAQWLKEHYPEIKVVVLSMINTDHMVIRMLKNGAKGYVLKDSEAPELRTAIKSVYQQGFHFNNLITHQLRRKELNNDLPETTLSSREIAFIRWACTERTYREIAREMGMSPRTIDGYRDAVFTKLNVRSRIGIALYAIRNGIVVL